MKLHRLSVTNYRGITHRDITFPERGVVVVGGANEVGKTSMIEALTCLSNPRIAPPRRTSNRSSPPSPMSVPRLRPRSVAVLTALCIASDSTNAPRPT